MTADPLVFCSPYDGVLLAPLHCGLLAVPAFIQQVCSACATTARAEVVVDLSQVETVDSGAFRALLWARRHCMAHRITLAVAPPAEHVLTLRQASLLRDLFPTPSGAAASMVPASRATPGTPLAQPAG